MRIRILKKFNVLTYLSIISILIFPINISKATDITGAIQNGNVYTISPEKYNNSNTIGFRQYGKFSLSENDIANLQFKNGMTKFVNIVNSNVNINGILNSINQSGQFYNGKVIFLSKGDFTVGPNALINVGALGVYTPSNLPDINNLASLSDSQFNNTLDSLKNNLAYSISINGKILSRNEVELYGSQVYTGSNSKIITGFKSKDTSLNSQETIATKTSVTEARKVADNLISSIVNLGNNKEAILNSNYEFRSQEGKITILSMGSTKSSLAGFIKGNGDFNITTNHNIQLSGNINNLSGDINISTNNNSVLTISENSDLKADNNININSLGKIVILGTLNSNNDINISEDGNADITLENNSVIKAGNEIFIRNNNTDSESTINILGSIISENDIIMDNKSKGDINIDGKVISNLKNITIANGADDYLDNIKITNCKSGNVNINGDILSNLDINILNNGIKDININNNSNIKSASGNIYIISSNKAKNINVVGNINAKEKLSIESGLNGKINIGDNSKIVSQIRKIEINQSRRSISGIKRDLKNFKLVLNADQNKNIDNKIINSIIKESSLSPSQIISSGNFKDYELIKSKNNTTFSQSQLKIKRESQRYEVANANMEFYLSSPNIVRVIDISKSGMGVQYNQELNIGEKIDIVVNYNGTSLFATAVVVRLDREKKIAGLKFVDIDEKAANEMLFFNMRN